MIEKVDCAFCDGTAKLTHEMGPLHFQSHTFTVKLYFYKCELCDKEFTTDETDTETLNQVHQRYNDGKWDDE